MSDNQEPFEKSRWMEGEEKKAIEKWRKLYPKLSDKELLEIDRNMKRYIQLVNEIAQKPKEPPEDTNK